MRKLASVCLLLGLCAVPVLAVAETYKDVPVVDVNCSKKVAANPDSHTRACALKCEASGFGIVTKNQQFHVLKIITDNGLRTRRGQKLTAQTFDAMLRKPIYAGWVYSSGVPEPVRGLHEPIVSQGIFEAVQRVLSGRKLISAPKRKHNPAFPLKHFVKCGTCGTPLTGGMNKGKLKHYANYWCRNPDCRAVKVSKSALESEFVEYLQTLRPDQETVVEFPKIASEVWSKRHADRTAMIKTLKTRLEKQKMLKATLLRAKLLGEVSQADYVQGNSDFDTEIDAITQQLNASHSRNGTLDSFLRFSKLMLVDISAAWQRAGVEQRVSVQNFLFQDGVAYDRTQKFLNTTNVTLFQQLRGLAHCKEVVGVPINDIFEHLDVTIAEATPLYELCASVLSSAPALRLQSPTMLGDEVGRIDVV